MKHGHFLFLAALIGTGVFAYHKLNNNRGQPSIQYPLQGVQLTWPSIGQAAIGSMEEGLLARSSEKEEVRPIASMAKVITALAIMEQQPIRPGEKGETYVITEDDITNLRAYISDGGSVLPLLIGMRLNQYQAMQRMLIASDNNMADMLADRIFGSIDGYVNLRIKC